MQAARTILVFADNVLPLTETFIKDQMVALKRWRGILIGLRKLDELSLDGLDVRVLRPTRPNLPTRLSWKVADARRTVPRTTIEALARERPRLVHAHFATRALRAWPIAKALNLPLLVTLHGYDINIDPAWWRAGREGSRMRRYPSRLLRLAGERRVHFLAVSEAIREQAIRFGIPDSKITVHYIGVDVKRFAPATLPISSREPRVLFVGRLVEKKGCEVLISAFAKVQAEVPDATLVIVGDGVLRSQLRTLGERLGLRIEFRGALSSADVRQELWRARVLCLPSITARNGDAEGFGMVLLEAQASGVPVVTSARGGATEGIVEGVTGFAFPEGNVNILAERLIEILTDDNIALSLSTAGPPFVAKNFDLHHCIETLEMLYDKFAGAN